MDAIVLLSTATVLFMVFLVIQGFIKLYIAKKEYAEENKKVIYKTKFKQVNYENDMKVLIDTIEEYSNNYVLTGLKEFHGTKNIINDSIFLELAKTVTIEVYTSLSDEYLELIATYVADPQLFIHEKVYYKILRYVLEINSKNINNLNK